MTQPNDEAFPVGCGEHVMNQKECGCHQGLTIREYFAAMAMGKQGIGIARDVAVGAVQLADALIEELNRKKA